MNPDIATNPLIAKLCLLYGPPSKDPVEARKIMAEFARLMAGYSDAEMTAAADKVLVKRKFKSWPTIAECVAELVEARQDAYDRNRPELRNTNPHPEWSKERFAIADKLVDSEMGREAAREGWILGLHDFCRNNQRLPHRHEIGEIRYHSDCAAGAVDMGVCHGALLKLANSMLDKREKLAKQVLGEAA